MTFDKALESHKQKMNERKTELLADKMFEEIGYKRNDDGSYPTYRKETDIGIYAVMFDIDDIDFCCSFYPTNGWKRLSFSQNINLHLAIHQKLKELGWI